MGRPGGNGPDVTVRLAVLRSPFYDKLCVAGTQIGLAPPFYVLADASVVPPADWLMIETRGGRGGAGVAGVAGTDGAAGAAGCPAQPGAPGGNGGNGAPGGTGGRGGRINIIVPLDDPFLAGIVDGRSTGGPGGPGGACVTEELWPGFKVSTAAYVNSLLRPEIIRDLELQRHGFELLPRNPSSFTPFPDGRYLLLGPDKELVRRQVAKFSRRDAERLPQYEAMLERVAAFIEPTLLAAPPDPWSLRPGDLLGLARLGWRFLKLGADGAQAIEVLTGAARPILDRWFESEELKIALATDAIIGAMASPSTPGTAYVLFHHVMGQCNGVRGVWGYVRGGMGGLTQALASAARQRGVEIRLNSPVARILTRDGRVTGVALEDGTELQASRVASNADAHVTFLKLPDPGALAPQV